MFHLCQSYRLSSSLSCKCKEIRAGCRHQCCSRKCKTKRLCHDLHRRSCSDKRTCTAARAGIAFRPVKFFFINLAALKLCTVHSELLQCQHFRTRIHGSTRNKHGRNIDSGKSDQISRHSFVAAGKIDTGIKRSRICMNLDHICNHFTAGQAVIDSVCSLAFAVTYIGAVVACTKSAFLCNSFPYLFLQDIQVAAARMTVTIRAFHYDLNLSQIFFRPSGSNAQRIQLRRKFSHFLTF